MKKESVLLFVALAFVVGVVVGVVATVVYEDTNLPVSIKLPASSVPSASINPDAQKQISVLQSILKGDPQNLKALVELGNLYFDSNQIDPAIQYYSRALEIDPRNADVRTDLGILYRKKGDFDRAIDEFRKAGEDDPRHVNSRYNLGIVLLHDKGNIKEAIKAWENYLRVEPDGPRAQNIRNQMEKMRAMAK